MEDIGHDPKRGEGLPRHRPRGGNLEGGGGDSQLLPRCRHCLPRLPPQIPGGLRYGDRHPQAQAASSGCGLEIGGPPCDLPGTEQGLRCLGQV